MPCAVGTTGKTYWQWNLLPGMVDKYTPHPEAWKSNTTENVRIQQSHMDHCYPSLGYILRRIESVLRDHPPELIKKVFILTNADAAFVQLLKEAIKESLKLDALSSASGDLGLDERARGAQPGVDMEIAARAEIFLGNGVSVKIWAFLFFLLMDSQQFCHESSQVSLQMSTF
jgi:hypothetical protein